jgi:hypothetical protein
MAVLSNPKGATGIMLAFFLFTLMCAWCATKLSNEFSPSEIVPDDSYTKDYFSAASKLGLFWDSSIRYNIIFKVVTANRSCIFLEEYIVSEACSKSTAT